MNEINMNYGVNSVLMSSANGTKYWIRMGYGADGHAFRVWSEATKPMELAGDGDWEVVFGTFTLPNSAGVDMVFVGGLHNFVIPSSCSLNVSVSNNNGSSFESYDKDSNEAHVFSSTGTQLRVKLTGNGHPNKSPFSCSKDSFYVDGHFPGNPVLPGVLIVEAFGQAAAALTAHGIDKKEYDNKLVFLMSVEKARFRNPVVPDCKLELKIEAIRSHGRVWKYKGEAFVEGKKMSDAQWSATIVDRK